MTTILMRLFFLLGLLVPADAHAQVPPPPLERDLADLASRLVETLRKGDADAYGQLLDPEVQVHDNGRLVASGRDAWMRRERPRMTADGVRIDVLAAYAGPGHVMLIEHFNSTASFGPIPAHCCWSYDAVRYGLRAGRIVRIDRLSGNSQVLEKAVGRPG